MLPENPSPVEIAENLLILMSIEDVPDKALADWVRRYGERLAMNYINGEYA